MKRFICLLCALLLLPLAACKAEEAAPTGSQSPAPTGALPDTAAPESQSPLPTPTPSPYTHPLTGEPCGEDLSGRRPAAIMLNNLMAALPQQGNSQADIIYECLAEGGITRMLALYQQPEKVGLIGSVRSARQYYWEIAKSHDAVFIHAGGSPEFYSTKASLNLFTVDGVNGYYSGADAGMFWRDRDRISGHHYALEHSLLTSGEAVSNMLAAQNLTAHSAGYAYEMSFTDNGTPAGGSSASVVTVPFSNYKTGVFRYDPASGLYKVEEYGQPYIDGNDETQVAVTNLLVLQTSYAVLDDAGRVRMGLQSGTGWFACGGRMIPITWQKGGPSDQFRYLTADGSPLSLGRGKSYVCLIPNTRSVAAE